VVFLARVFGLDGGKNFGVSLFNQNVAVVHGSSSNEWNLGEKRVSLTRAAQANG
jgi:hypothetical protein